MKSELDWIRLDCIGLDGFCLAGHWTGLDLTEPDWTGFV